MPDILISEVFFGAEVESLRGRFEVVEAPEMWREPERLLAAIPECRALIVRNQTRVDAALIQAGRRLEVIGRAGVGMDNIDLRAAQAGGVTIVYTPEENSNSVAELTLGLMLALARKLPAADRETRAGGWDRKALLGVELAGKTLGLIGCGRIGRLTAAKAQALGMEVIAYDPHLGPGAEPGPELLSLEDLLARADFVSCHVPETEETKGMLGFAQFSRMKPAAYFVNAARGGIVDEEGLARALAERRIAGAALDVRAQEPPGEGNALAAMENVILTPHVGAFTYEAQERVVASICHDVAAVLSGEEPRHVVK